MTRAYATLRIAFLSCFIAFSVVDADVILKVTGDNVNLRAIADGESEVVSQVSRGTILYADKFFGEDWVSVAVPAGVAVWVYAELVRNDIVAVSKLSVRSGPGINYRTVGMLLKGEKVISHGTLNGWLKISAPKNCRVWISNKYVELADFTVEKTVVKPVEKPEIKPIPKPVVKPVTKPIAVTRPEIVAKPIEPTAKPIESIVDDNSPDGELPDGKDWLAEPTLQKDFIQSNLGQKDEGECKVGSMSQKQLATPVEVVSIKEPKVDESVAELVSMSTVDELEQLAEKPFIELVSETACEEEPVEGVVDDIAISTVSEVISIPEKVVMPVIIDNEIRNIEPDETVVVSVAEEVTTVEPVVVADEQPEPVEVITESVSTEIVSVEDGIVDPEIVEIVTVDKYASIDTNNIPAGIDISRLVLSMPQGNEVVLSGKLKRAGRVLRRRPSRYRLISSIENCYVISEKNNLDEFLAESISITGRSYWLQGIRDMVVVIDNIKKISIELALP